MMTDDRFLLWIDDDQQLLDHAVSRLRENGIRVVVEPSIDKAVETIRTRQSELLGVLVDLMMDPGELLSGLATEGGYETGFRLIDYLQSEGLMADLVFKIFTNAQTGFRQYPPDGSKHAVRIVQKSRYKGVKFLNFIKSEFVFENV